MSKFKVGDRVRIVSKGSSSCCTNCIHCEKYKWIGAVGRVEDFDHINSLGNKGIWVRDLSTEYSDNCSGCSGFQEENLEFEDVTLNASSKTYSSWLGMRVPLVAHPSDEVKSRTKSVSVKVISGKITHLVR